MHHAKGGAGATELGKAVEAACKQPSSFKFLYDLDLPLKVIYLLNSSSSPCQLPSPMMLACWHPQQLSSHLQGCPASRSKLLQPAR